MEKRRILNLTIVFLLVVSGFVIFFTGDVAAQQYNGDIYATNSDGDSVKNFTEGSDLYFSIFLNESVNVEVTVDLEVSEADIRRRTVTTEDGIYKAHEEGNYNPIDLTGLDGEYPLILKYNGTEINQDMINVYEPDFTQGSTVMTTADDHETPKDIYSSGETIYYSGGIKDGHDNSPEEHPYHISIFLAHEGVEEQKEMNTIDQENGSFSGDFNVDQEGNFTLIIRDPQDEYVELANDTFTVLDIYLSISIEPDLQTYTQGQQIELRVESDYPTNIDVAIMNSTEEPYHLMDEALWENQELKNESWNAEYTIPEKEEDGTYYVVVNSTETGETLDYIEFEIQKFSLEVETDKDVYHPGEEVKAYYTVENLLDGSQYTSVDVEWMMEYETKDGEKDSLSGVGINGEFGFTLPEDAAVDSQTFPFGPQKIKITVWANDSEGRYQDEVEINRQVGGLNLDLNVESNEYFVGQTLYVELNTSIGNVEVDVELHHDDDVIDQRTVVTDGSGYYMVTMDLSGKTPGHYVVTGNATWNDMCDTDDDDFELIEESKRLSVMLERDKGVNPYYPGEEGIVFYTITRGGETVTNEANVKYRLYSTQRVLDKDFAEGGEIGFEIPSDYSPSSEGDLWLDVEATMNRETDGFSTIRIPVSIGDILLNPDQWEYEAGDEINFEYEFHGIGENEIDSLEYRVLDPNYELIMSGTPIGGTFEIVIPKNPSSSYRVELEAITNGGETIETVESISQVSGFYLETEIVTESDYTTGVYEPGKEIEISYELVSRDGSPLPETVRVWYDFVGHPEAHSFRTNQTKGTFTLTIPELNDGEQIVDIGLNEYRNKEIIDVESDPWWGNRIVLGASLSGLLMTILLIFTLIIAGLALYRTQARGTSPGKRPPRQPEGMGNTEIPPEQKGEGEGFHIEEGESKQENQWSGVEQEESVDESQMDSEEE